MAINQVWVRAQIQFGSVTVVTPYILSFNVEKARGQISSFNASVKIPSNSVGNFSGSTVSIKAGEGSASNLIFTGIVRNINVMPCHDDPSFAIVNISGNDVLSLLQGKKYTRRCRASQGTWVSIQGVIRKGIKTPSFTYVAGGHYFDITSGDLFSKDNVTRARKDSTPKENVKTPSEVSKNVGVNIEATPTETKTTGT